MMSYSFQDLCDFFHNAYISKNTLKITEFFNNEEMVTCAKDHYPMIDIIWENRKQIAFLYRNNLKHPPICKNTDCNNYVKFNRTFYPETCGYSCSGKINYENKREKIKNTHIKKYGVEHYSKTDEYNDRVKKSSLEKYGVEHYAKTDEFTERVKQTNTERYGVEHPMYSNEVKNKLKKTNIEKYGSSNANKSHYNEEYKNIFDKDKSETFKKLLYDNGTYELADIIGCYASTIYYHAKKQNTTLPYRPRSQQEKKIIDLFEQYNINFVCNDRNIIAPLELDFYLPDFNIAIEINGLYWHSDRTRDKNYHYIKWKQCQEKGIDLYSIFEDDLKDNEDMWINKILHLCKASKYNKIYARKCKVIEIDGKIAKQFLDKNHLQGNKYSSINIGLYYQNELVSVMSFSNTRNNNNGIAELTRFCNRMDTQVVGGASKLLKHFINNYGKDYEQINSFSDNTYSDGGLYKTLGFDLETELKSDYKYLVSGKREHKANYRKSKIKQKFDIDVSHHTEKELMNILGIHRIWDCGKKKWTMTLDKDDE